MKIKKILKKLNIIDWIIIIGIILAICFAFIYISHDETQTESTSLDETTSSKIGAKYASYYIEGDIITSKIKGYNATNGEKININGVIKWEDDDSGSRPKILLETNGNQYLCAFYNDEVNADIYIEEITLEKNGTKYNNIADITISPEKINTLEDLINKIPNNTTYEITTSIAINPQNSQTYQELKNRLLENHYRISIKPTNILIEDKLEIVQGTEKDIKLANTILGVINGYTEPIHLRVYNYDNNTLKIIEENYNITNINYIA